MGRLGLLFIGVGLIWVIPQSIVDTKPSIMLQPALHGTVVHRQQGSSYEMSYENI